VVRGAHSAPALRVSTAAAIPSAVVWFTGLSGAGKTTIAARIAEQVGEHRAVELIDGDALRTVFPNLGFTREARDEHVRRVGHLASRLEHHGVLVLVALVSPYRAARDFARSLAQNFVEVHVATSLAECERRDVKGLYARARRGEITMFTGIDDPYEPPDAPELAIDTTATSIDAAADRVLAEVVMRFSPRRLS
jgi:adenylylsulfate kinase